MRPLSISRLTWRSCSRSSLATAIRDARPSLPRPACPTDGCFYANLTYELAAAAYVRTLRRGDHMAIDLFRTKGTPLDRQLFTWRDLVQPPYSKLDDDAFTRVRVILMNGIESEALRFGHACARMNAELQRALAQIRRVEQHQQTLINWLNPGDQSPLETTIGFEQV